MGFVANPFILFPSNLTLPAGASHRYNDSDMPNVSGKVPSWNDIIGTDNLTDLGNSTRTPTFSASAINGHNAILFDGVNHMLQKAFTLVQTLTYFYVMKQVTWATNDTISNGIGSNQMLLRQHTASPKVHQYAGLSGADNADMIIGNWHIVSCVYNGASSSIRVDDNAETATSIGTQDPGGIELGRNNGVNYANFEIAELIVYPNAIVGATRNDVHNFLKSKYAL